MIQISHQQARYLLHEMEDRRLPDEQWAALQAHLESCPECRAYRDRLAALEKDLRRGLHGRWGGIHPALKGIPERVITFRKQRKQRRLWTRRGVVWLLVLLALFTFARRAQLFSPPPSPTPAPTASPPAPTPTPDNGFRGLIAYQASPAGNSDIFLLNVTGASASDTSNLTNDPSEDTGPTWSPDGEWIAFLSNRTGKRELYVITVAGTRLTQLTDDPQIDWQGPLSWSYDGKMIGLAGIRLEQKNERWLYVVPLDGSGPRSLPGTRGDPGWVHFSPSQPLLATSSSIFDYSNNWLFEGWYGLSTIENTYVPGFPAGPGVDFDWAVGGNSLVYLFQGQPLGEKGLSQSEVRLSPSFGLNNRDHPQNLTSLIIASTPPGIRLRSPTYMPGGPYIAVLVDLNNTGCWTLRFIHSILYDQTEPTDVKGLCVQSPLERASWQSGGSGRNGRWLVVNARPADPTTGKPSGSPGLYAVILAAPSPAVPPVIQRLSDLPQEVGVLASSATVNPIPRVRPSAASLNIEPVAARPSKKPAFALPQPPHLPGDLLVAQPDPSNTANNAIIDINMDGSQQRIILPAGAANTCPVWSPDRQWIAFTAQTGNSSRKEVFVMDADGGRISQLTLPVQPGAGSSPGFDCPVWSPDGTMIAAVRYDPDGVKLVTISRRLGVLSVLTIGAPARMTRPVWSPDNRRVFLAEQPDGSDSGYILYINLPSGPGIGAGQQRLHGDGRWGQILAFSISPDERYMAVVAAQPGSGAAAPIVDMLVYNTGQTTPKVSKELPGYMAQAQKSPGRIFWIKDHQILFAQANNWLSSHKAAFLSLDLQTGNLQTLASSDDALYDWVYRDGWLVYSSESGIWVQKLDPTGAALPAPIRISDQPASSLEMK